MGGCLCGPTLRDAMALQGGGVEKGQGNPHRVSAQSSWFRCFIMQLALPPPVNAATGWNTQAPSARAGMQCSAATCLPSARTAFKQLEGVGQQGWFHTCVCMQCNRPLATNDMHACAAKDCCPAQSAGQAANVTTGCCCACVFGGGGCWRCTRPALHTSTHIPAGIQWHQEAVPLLARGCRGCGDRWGFTAALVWGNGNGGGCNNMGAVVWGRAGPAPCARVTRRAAVRPAQGHGRAGAAVHGRSWMLLWG